MLRSYPPVTTERLKQPEPQNWLMIRGNYSGWGYSALDQLTPANVAKLEPVWMMATGMDRGHEAAPIVNNGVMFVSTPGEFDEYLKRDRINWQQKIAAAGIEPQ